VITPRQTRLVRVRDLRTFRDAIDALVRGGGRPVLVIVPTRSAARQLSSPARGVTRDELYAELHAALADPPRLLTSLERDAIAQASAREAADATEVTFRLRPGLIAEMLRFYDQLRRQSQQVQRFEELIQNALGPEDLDSSARRMRQQTRFLAAAFRAYEQRVHDSGACDEHLLRERLIQSPAAQPVRRIVVSVADWIADADGLFVADFDLLSRVPALERLDIVATDAILGSGFHERLHRWLPGLEEETFVSSRSLSRPAIITPPGADPDTFWWTFRDREEELVAIARHLKADRRANDAAPLDRVAVVFKNPLPYLYLAADVFGSASIPYHPYDAFPLAAEPAAAALDLILDAADANFTRDALIALLRCPYLTFDRGDRVVTRASISALDRALSNVRYLGDRAQLEAIEQRRIGADAAPAYSAAVDAAADLSELRASAPASTQLRRLLAFWNMRSAIFPPSPALRRTVEAPAEAGEPSDACGTLDSRETRARSAISQTLTALAQAHAAHHDPAWTLADLSLAVRRAIEEQTFEIAPAERSQGVRLLDDRAARYGEFDDLFIVGVVEPEWPERPRRNIFYPPALLKSLGWPSEKDRRSAADAHVVNLVGRAERRTVLSVFTLEDDALVTRSMQLDEVPRARLSTFAREAAAPARIFTHEALAFDPIAWQPLSEGAAIWARLRSARSDAADPRFHGTVPTPSARMWSVSALETYIGCPFRFFAQHVLDLAEEPTDEEVMDPRRQGQFVHEVFEKFFAAWQGAGHGSITERNLDQARVMFADVVEQCLAQLPEAEAGLERTRLLGSPAAAGLGEAVMRMEAERPIPVVERLLEHRLDGEFTFAASNGSRQLRLRGKADRLDLLADGTFRLIDYKLGWPPDRRKALQLPIYGLCAEQRLRKYRGRDWMLSDAMYLAFKGPRRVVPLFQDSSERATVLADAQERLITTVDAIANGQFPPTPDDVYRCETCSYSAVCRKDYVGDV
jgi:RecB family exonuclease